MTTGTEIGKEPGNWELYRGLERVEKAVNDMVANSLTGAVFAIEKQALESKILLLEKADTEHRAAELALAKTLTDYAKEQEAQKARNRLFVYGIVLAPLITTLIAWLLGGGLAAL